MIHTITDGNLTAKIDSLGAQQISMTDKAGTEYIWQRNPEYWKDCAPILFPVVGQCLDGKITVDGTDYPMRSHGFARHNEFTVAEKTESSITLRLCDNEKTREIYPFSFCFDVIYTIENGALTTTMKVKNTDDKDICFGVGGHPGYRCPLTDGEVFTDYELNFLKPVTLDSAIIDSDVFISSTETQRIITDSETLSLVKDFMKVNDTYVFENLDFNKVIYRSKKSGKGLTFSFENFTSFAVWCNCDTPEDDGYICLEPWNSMGKRTGETAELKNKKDIITLAPGKEFSCSYCAEPLK